MSFLNKFNKQNFVIKVGYISLVVSLIVLILGLILIGSTNFVPKDANMVDPNLVGNGFDIISKNGISVFLNSQGYMDFKRLTLDFTSAALLQLLFGIIFLVICVPVFIGIAILALSGGYFKKWLYT